MDAIQIILETLCHTVLTIEHKVSGTKSRSQKLSAKQCQDEKTNKDRDFATTFVD